MRAKLPWEIYPELTLDRLLDVARIINRVHEEVARHIQPEKGDLRFGRWVPGSTEYSRVVHELEEAHKSGAYPWLGIVDDSMQFVASIGGVPFRFFNGDPETPSRSARKRSTKEQRANLELFDLNTVTRADIDWAWRFAVDVNPITAEVMSITIEEVDSTGSYRNAFEIPFRQAAAGLTVLTDHRPEGVEFAPPQPEEIPAAEETGTEAAEGGTVDDDRDE
ncbi:MAG TPA: hypothetical protein VFZ09_38840 [Archangium sp.]|uniref:hypothetical protein n=1 Tax=Archangium sp. TaxID=1872627 RepID=UPI002E3361DE|nr:hypothetical protein [Archangium sp.]HEX5752235.1 hypothetical protein [Archangium sp.]